MEIPIWENWGNTGTYTMTPILSGERQEAIEPAKKTITSKKVIVFGAAAIAAVIVYKMFF